MILIINKPTRATNETATDIYHILTSSYTETNFQNSNP